MSNYKVAIFILSESRRKLYANQIQAYQWLELITAGSAWPRGVWPRTDVVILDQGNAWEGHTMPGRVTILDRPTMIRPGLFPANDPIFVCQDPLAQLNAIFNQIRLHLDLQSRRG
jgi:hypothetical protein